MAEYDCDGDDDWVKWSNEEAGAGDYAYLTLAANKKALVLGALQRDGSAPMAGALAMGGHAITGVGAVDGRDVSADGATLDAHGTAIAGHTGDIAGLWSAVGTVQGNVTALESATTAALNSHASAANPHSGSVPTSRTVAAGTGLTGGGDLTANRTLAVSFGTGATQACAGNDGRLSDARPPSLAALADNDVVARAVGGAAVGKHVQLLATAADVANATTTLATVTGLTATLKANATYRFDVDFDYITSATTVGLQMSTAFSGTTTAVRFGLVMGTSATAMSATQATANGTKVGPTATGPGATARPARFAGTIVVGGSGGTLTIQLAAGAAGSATIRARATLLVVQV